MFPVNCVRFSPKAVYSLPLRMRSAPYYLFLSLLIPSLAFAVGGSTNYQIPKDVQGSGGGDEAKSTNYTLVDTLGEGAIGPSGSTNYGLNAGYRQPDDYVSLNCTSPVALGTVNFRGQMTGTTTCTVITDALAGYSLSWQAATAAMISGSNSLNAFTPTVANTPSTWTVASGTGAWGGRLQSASTDSAVEWGTDSSSEKWLNVATSSRTIVSRSTRTSVSGSTEYVQFRAEVGSTAIQPDGSYSVTVTLTAVSL